MIKFDVRNLLYYISFFIVLITQFFDTVNIETNALSRYASLFSIVLLSILFFMQKHYTKRNLIIFILVFCVLCLAIYFSRREVFLLNMFLLIILSTEINFEKLLKTYFCLLIGMIFIVLILNKIGIIDSIYDYRRLSGNVRTTFGFKFPTFLPNLFFHLTLVYYFLKKKLYIVDMLIIVTINSYLYMLTDTKAVYYYILFFIFIVYLVRVMKINLSVRLCKNIISKLTVISVSVPVVMSLWYSRQSDFIIQLDYLLTSRLNLGYQGIQRYGLNFFGANIEWVTLDKPKLTGLPYFYVDSSYLNIWLNYGLFMLLLLVIGFYFGSSKLFSDRLVNYNIVYLIVFSLLILHSMFDPQFFTILYNPFLLLIGKNFAVTEEVTYNEFEC